MTNVDFYIQLSEIIDDFKVKNITINAATTLIKLLNEAAKKSNLDLQVDLQILNSVTENIPDEEYIPEDEYEDVDIDYEYDDY